MIINIADPEDPRLEPYKQIRERDLVGREGLFVAEGKIILSILLARKEYALESVLLLDSRVSSNAGLLANIPAQTPVYVVPENVIDTVAGFHVHRGILAIGKRSVAPGLADLIRQTGPESLILVMSDISNHDNVGSMFRNAAAFSASAVLLDELCCDPLYRKALRVSVGGVLTVPWRKGSPVSAILDALTENGFAIAALSPSGALPVNRLPKSGKRALLVGSEGHGLPAPLLSRLATYKIPMCPQFDSLNVATASGIALFSASRYSD